MGKRKDKDEEKKSSRWDWLEVIADLIEAVIDIVTEIID